MKILKTEGFFKSAKRKFGALQETKSFGTQISTQKENKFYKKLYDCIFNNKLQRLDELLSKQTVRIHS